MLAKSPTVSVELSSLSVECHNIAYKKFTEFLRTEYDPKGRPEISIESLPDGKRRYTEAVKMMTTLNVTPAEVHELGTDVHVQALDALAPR